MAVCRKVEALQHLFVLQRIQLADCGRTLAFVLASTALIATGRLNLCLLDLSFEDLVKDLKLALVELQDHDFVAVGALDLQHLLVFVADRDLLRNILRARLIEWIVLPLVDYLAVRA